MSDHATFRELLALRLYGELDPADGPRLDAHLAGCAACRALAGELVRDLGALVPLSAPDGDLPAGWRERLSAAARPAPAPRARPWLAFAAGLAAGLLCMALAQDLGPAARSGASGANPAVRTATNAPAEPAALPALESAPPRAPEHGFAGLTPYLQGR